MAITIEQVILNPDKPHAPFVRVILDSGVAVEFTVRKSKYDSLTASGKKAYVLECMEYHFPTARGQREARRATWDADDKAQADAALAAAKAEQEAKFLFVATGVTTDKESKPTGITATVRHHGRVAAFTTPYTEDKAALAAALREAFAAWEAQEQGKEAFLASMSVS